MRLLGIKNREASFFYLIIYQAFKSLFSIENETLRLFSSKKTFSRKKAFALSGRQACVHHYPGRCPGLRASALSGRVGHSVRTELSGRAGALPFRYAPVTVGSGRVGLTSENAYPLDSIKEGADEPVADDACDVTYESNPGDVLHIPAEGNLLQAHNYHTSGTTDNQH